MLKEYTTFVSSSTFLEVLLFLTRREFKSPSQKMVADRGQKRLVEMNTVWILHVSLTSGQKQSGRKDGDRRTE